MTSNSSATNVISFPKNYQGPVKDPEAFQEEIEQNLEIMKHYHISETINNLVPMIFTQLEIAGYDVIGEDDEMDDWKYNRDAIFIMEALKSFMCRHYGIYHPFQRISNAIFEIDEKDPDIVRIAKSLNLELHEGEKITPYPDFATEEE